jgi:predicted negative regulator of RcsB-dependent stress response
LSTGDLLEDLAQAQLEAAAFSNDHAELLMEPGIVATMLTSWHTVRPKAQELARLLSLTLPAPIPWELIVRCVPSGPPATPQPVNRYWEDALAELVGGNLLDAQDADRPLYALHSLVRQFFSLQRRDWEAESHWRRELGAAAQDLASQWKRRDLVLAEEYWRQACQAQPTNIWAGYGLGLAMLHLGQLDSAKKAFVQCWRNGVDSNDLRGVACACEGIGDVLRAQGDTARALAAFQEGLNITEILIKHDPTNMLWKRDLSISHNRIGDVLVARGDTAGALVEYNAAMTIREILVKIDPSNMEWQHDLAISHSSIGDVLVAQGDSAGAQGAYHAAMAIREILAKIDPSNMEWQHDLSIGHERIGGLLEIHGDHAGALTQFKTALSIRENLTQKNPLRNDWHRGISIIHERIGDMLGVVGDSRGALVAHKKALSIMETLVRRDPSNTEWQRDLSVSHNKMGDVLISQGDGPGALVAYQAGLAIAEGLVTLDPVNTQWQCDLSMSQEKIGDVLMLNEEGTGALAAYQAGLTIREDLARRDPANIQWQVDVARSCGKLGTMEAALPVSTRRTYLQRGLNITLTLKQAGRLHANQDYTALFEEHIRKLESSD